MGDRRGKGEYLIRRSQLLWFSPALHSWGVREWAVQQVQVSVAQWQGRLSFFTLIKVFECFFILE
jgi:hypothetical protein